MAARKTKRRGFRTLAENELARITFHGAAGEVTGSAFLLETRSAAVLFDCGMFQGGRAELARNRRPFPFDPAGLEAVVLTHAHIDHSGLLPKLVRDGFRGRLHVSAPTDELLAILLLDSAHIHEQEAALASRRLRRRPQRAAPAERLRTARSRSGAPCEVHEPALGASLALCKRGQAVTAGS